MISSPGLDALNDQFGIPGVVRLASGRGSLPFIAIKTSSAEASVYLHGAHVTHYQPAGQKPVFFLSERSYFRDDKPIRGGIPLIFPWFGQRQHDLHAPMHGFARVSTWAIESVTQDRASGDVAIALRLDQRSAVNSGWPFEFEAIYRITIGASLGLSLQVHSSTTFEFEEALHTYFNVSDVREVSVTGLESLPYLDKTNGMQRITQPQPPIQFTGHTDRIYLGAKGRAIVLDDPGLRRRIRIHSANAAAAVLWNPWETKIRTIADLAPGEWSSMLCVETANVADHAVTLESDEPHVMQASITCEPLG